MHVRIYYRGIVSMHMLNAVVSLYMGVFALYTYVYYIHVHDYYCTCTCTCLCMCTHVR